VEEIVVDPRSEKEIMDVVIVEGSPVVVVVRDMLDEGAVVTGATESVFKETLSVTT
jgi:hypothetical protein